jgi:hypothetical protein
MRVHGPSIRARLDGYQFQVRSVGKADQRHLGGMVAVRAAVLRFDTGRRQPGLHGLQIAPRHRDMIDLERPRAK